MSGMSYTTSARGARGMGYFEGYDFDKNPRCPFCNEFWSSRKTCGDPDPFIAGGWRGMAERRKVREGKATMLPDGTYVPRKAGL